MADKKTFILGTEWAEQMLDVPQEDFTTVVKAVFEYAVNGNRVEVNGLAKALVNQMVAFIDNNNEKYKDVCEKRREAGRKGGLQKQANATNSKQMLPNATKCYQMGGKAKQTVDDNDNDYDNENENEYDYDNVFPSESPKEKGDYVSQREVVERIVERWNNLPDCIPKVKNIDMKAERFKMLKERLKTYTEQDVMSAIDNIETSPFLLGDNKNRWVIKFDWFVRPNNFPKVFEGQYNTGTVTVMKPKVARGISIIDEMIARGEFGNE